MQAKEAASVLPVTLDVVQEISNLSQLEAIIEASGSSIVVVALYTRVISIPRYFLMRLCSKPHISKPHIGFVANLTTRLCICDSRLLKIIK